jgi:thiol-disulfide isomerase/thioredoxin
MRISLAAKALGLMAATTLTLAACSSGSQDSAGAAGPSNSTSPEAMATTGFSSGAADGANDGAMTDDAAAGGSVAEQLQFTSTLLADGAAFDGASLAGKDTILWFWAPWCPVCQNEAPDIAAASTQLPDGVTLIGVPGKSDVDAMQTFTAAYGLDNVDHIVDADGSLWQDFEVLSQPAFALINDDGTVTTIPGSMSTEGILDAANQLAAS